MALRHPAWSKVATQVLQALSGSMRLACAGLPDKRRGGGRVLVALDGTEYVCPQWPGCPQCLQSLLFRTAPADTAKPLGPTRYDPAWMGTSCVAPEPVALPSLRASQGGGRTRSVASKVSQIYAGVLRSRPAGPTCRLGLRR